MVFVSQYNSLIKLAQCTDYRCHAKINCLIFTSDGIWLLLIHYTLFKGCCGCDRMIVGFTIIYVISAYYRWGCEFESRPGGRYVLDTALCDKVCQWLATGQWFSPVSCINKTDRHYITEILLKVVLSTITLTH